MKSWHDYHIVRYEVNSKDRVFSFHVAWPYETESDIKRAIITFKGVLGYHIENDAFGNIILDIEEIQAEELVKKNKKYIENSFKWSGAFGEWAKDIENISNSLTEKGIKGFILSSSYGMSGWLLAESIEVEHA